jgi:type VI secretion system protein ImpM
VDTLIPQSIGWYGKLPSRGDFVGGGLPRAWLRSWDDWLQRALAGAARQLGAGALRERLAAMPSWHWLVPAGQPEDPAWCGVVAASTDRVGRAFPLLVAEACDAAALDRVALADLRARAQRVSAWLDSARASSSPKEFDAGTAQLAATPWAAAPLAPAAPEDGVAGLRARWPAAASFWWRIEPAADAQAPFAEDWPPRETLLLDWLGESA